MSYYKFIPKAILTYPIQEKYLKGTSGEITLNIHIPILDSCILEVDKQ